MHSPNPPIDPWDLPTSEEEWARLMPAPCKNYVEHGHCYKKTKGICQLLHDPKDRAAALERKRLEKVVLEEKRQQERVANVAKNDAQRKAGKQKASAGDVFKSLSVNIKSSNNTEISAGKGKTTRKYKVFAEMKTTYAISACLINDPDIANNFVEDIDANGISSFSWEKSLEDTSTRISSAETKKSKSKQGNNTQSSEVAASTSAPTTPASVGSGGDEHNSVSGGIWKKDQALHASRQRLQENYGKQGQNLAELPGKASELTPFASGVKELTESLATPETSPPGFCQIDGFTFKNHTAGPPVDILVPNSSIDLTSVYKFWATDGKYHAFVLCPHEQVVKYLTLVETSHNVEMCRDYARGQVCQHVYAKRCPHSHDSEYRQEIRRSIDRYVKIRHPYYDLVQKKFTYVFTKRNPVTWEMIRYTPIELYNTTTTSEALKTLDNPEIPEGLKTPEVSKALTTSEVTYVPETGKAAYEEVLPMSGSFPLNGNLFENEGRVEMYAWCKKNLSRDMQAKYMETYVQKGFIPAKDMSVLPAEHTSTDRFEYFSLLPGEIRNAIWAYALVNRPVDCLVRQTWEYEDSDYNSKYGRKLEHLCTNNELFYVNRESRSITLGNARLTFGSIYDRERILFDYGIDRLFIVSRNSGDLIDTIDNMLVLRDRNRVKYLMVPLRHFIRNTRGVSKAIASFAALELVWFAVGDGHEDQPLREIPNLQERIQLRLTSCWNNRLREERRMKVLNGEMDEKDIPQPFTPVPKALLSFIPAIAAHGFKIDIN